MPSTPIGRRALLQRAAALLAASSLAGKAFAKSCVAPDGADASLRQSLHYVDPGPNPAQQCAACGFFSEPDGACGKCAIFNGSTDADGHCDSWAARG